MTFRELQERAKFYAQVGGFTDTLTPPAWAALVARAYREHCLRVGAVVTTDTISVVASTSEYNLPSDKRTGKVYRVWLDEEPLDHIGMMALLQQHPTYPFDDEGTPTSWYQPSGQSIGLYPCPSASGTLTLLCVQAPSDLAADTDVPVIDDRDHEDIARLAYVLHVEPVATGDEAKRCYAVRAEYERNAARQEAENSARRDVGRVLQRRDPGRSVVSL